jgi:hypothetical protein
MVRFVGPAIAVVILAGLVIAYAMTRQPAGADMPAGGAPTLGYALHIDADYHFGDAHPAEIAHHWCKKVSSSLTECQLYDSDRPNARLVGVETIVPAAVWQTFPAHERALWHYHKVELRKIHATLPDTPKDQQAAIIASIMPTYGKVYILWDPLTSQAPMGQPTVTVLH